MSGVGAAKNSPFFMGLESAPGPWTSGAAQKGAAPQHGKNPELGGSGNPTWQKDLAKRSMRRAAMNMGKELCSSRCTSIRSPSSRENSDSSIWIVPYTEVTIYGIQYM